MVKAVLGVLLVVVAVVILTYATGIIGIPFFNLSKKIDLNYGVVDKVYDTDYCLANYEWFKDRAEGIKGMQDKIAIQKSALADFESAAGPRDKWTFEDKQTDSDLRNKVSGLENIRVTMVNEYNSRSQQLNRVACKDLPLFFNL